MEFNLEQMAAEVANRVLDEYEYKGKTIRAWADILTHPKTNADRIRAMSDEELAWFLWNCAQPCCPPINCAFKKCGAEKCWFSGLKSPADS